MDNKNKSYFVKLILAITVFVIFLIGLGLIAQMVKNKRAVNSQPQILVSPEPTAAPVVKDETADWKTYRNEKYGYEVKFSNNWEGIETSFVTDYASFTPEKRDMAQAGFWIRVFENSNKLSIKEWWDKEYVIGDAVYELKGAFLSEGKSGFPVIVFKEKNGLEYNYLVFSKDNYIFIISSPLADDKINQIFSTFKFTDKDQTADWQTYSKPGVSFTFKYPKDWEITADYFYETAAGSKAIDPTVILQKIGNGNAIDEISINLRQFSCEGGGKCVNLFDNRINAYVGTRSENPEILAIFDKIVKSFEKKDETSDWQTCKNTKYAYEIKYPLNWKVWLPGAPEARMATCGENLSLIAFSPNIYAYPDQQQINIDVYDQSRLKGTVWKGITSLADYLKITPVKIKKETIIDGEKLIWRDTADNQLITFHDGSIYYFSVYNIDNSALNQILSTFKFTNR